MYFTYDEIGVSKEEIESLIAEPVAGKISSEKIDKKYMDPEYIKERIALLKEGEKKTGVDNSEEITKLEKRLKKVEGIKAYTDSKDIEMSDAANIKSQKPDYIKNIEISEKIERKVLRLTKKFKQDIRDIVAQYDYPFGVYENMVEMIHNILKER